MRRAAPLILVVLLARCGGDRHAGPPVAVRTPVASPAPRATPAPVDTRLAVPVWRFTTARLDGRVALRISPGGRAVARVGPVTEFGSRRVLSVVGRTGGWLRVLVPERPNGATAWIPAAAARLGGTDVALVVDRSARTLTVRRDGRTVDRVTLLNVHCRVRTGAGREAWGFGSMTLGNAWAFPAASQEAGLDAMVALAG